MPVTYYAIATTTVGAGGASDITFSSIPSTYTDLLLKISMRTNQVGNYEQIALQFNGSTASNYSARLLYGLGTGSGGSASSGTTTKIQYAGYATTSGASANTFSNVEIYIPNYTGSTAKSVSADGVTEKNATDAIASLTAGLWSLTNAITSIKIFGNSAGTLQQYSTATLYGIKNS